MPSQHRWKKSALADSLLALKPCGASGGAFTSLASASAFRPLNLAARDEQTPSDSSGLEFAAANFSPNRLGTLMPTLRSFEHIEKGFVGRGFIWFHENSL